MCTRTLRICTVALVSALAIPVLLSAADAPRTQPAATRPVVSAPAIQPAFVWDWLTGLWDAIGCSLDPSGGCAPNAGTPAPTDASEGRDLGEIGCSLDPSGCSS
jgi:hypothetical protein